MATLSGGDKLERKLQEIAAQAGKAGTLRVGFLEGAKYPDGTPVAMVAAVQEYGAPGKGIPSRPFFRSMIEKRSPKWGEQLGKIAAAQNLDMERTLDLMGQMMAGQLRDSILNLTSPPLSARTIARKGFSKPLIEHAVLINSTWWEYTVGGNTVVGKPPAMSSGAMKIMKKGKP